LLESEGTHTCTTPQSPPSPNDLDIMVFQMLIV
jgi:hypothetical protein